MVVIKDETRLSESDEGFLYNASGDKIPSHLVEKARYVYEKNRDLMKRLENE
nr:MAG TPA: hypothetical protein [Caudoviricetes sp.]